METISVLGNAIELFLLPGTKVGHFVLALALFGLAHEFDLIDIDLEALHLRMKFWLADTLSS